MQKYWKLLDDIKKNTPKPEILADPKFPITYLHYPYAGFDRVQDRFSFDENGLFEYHSRRSFKKILDRIEALRMDGRNGYRQMYIHGIEGYGKSHVICAIVSHLMAIGQRIIYVADCRWLTVDKFSCMGDCFRLAFADKPDVLELIDECSSSEDLIRLSNTLAEKGITMKFFADQANALDVGSAGRMSSDTRIRAIEFLNRITRRHFFIQSASANFELAVQARLTQEHVDKLNLNSGLTKVSTIPFI